MNITSNWVMFKPKWINYLDTVSSIYIRIIHVIKICSW